MSNINAINAIEKFRRQKKLSYQALADQMGADKATVWKHCHGRCVPTGSFLLLYRKLGIDLEELIPHRDPPPAPSASGP